MTKEYKINMADICELAHTLTVRDCTEKGYRINITPQDEEERYTKKAQAIFDSYYDLITNTLGV